MSLAGYETTVVMRPSASEDLQNSLKTKVEGIIKSEGGQVYNYEDWGNRKLAYTRKRESKGRYHHFVFTGKESTIAEIERNLRLNENVLLYLSLFKNEAVEDEEITALKESTVMSKLGKERPSRTNFMNEGYKKD